MCCTSAWFCWAEERRSRRMRVSATIIPDIVEMGGLNELDRQPADPPDLAAFPTNISRRSCVQTAKAMRKMRRFRTIAAVSVWRTWARAKAEAHRASKWHILRRTERYSKRKSCWQMHELLS